jgi:hypothetical protein
MAVTSTPQTIMNGPRNLVVKCKLTGDGTDVTALTLIDASAFGVAAGATLKVRKIWSQMDGFTAALLWDATTDVEFANIPDGEMTQDFSDIGGLINNSGSGITGDINITTLGNGAGEDGTIILWMNKRAA